jgi:hypothetical protein
LELERLIREFTPKLIIVKSLSEYQKKSENQRRVVKEIVRTAELSAIRVKQSAFEDAKRKLVMDKPTKTKIFSILKEIYPELLPLAQFQNRWQAEYYTPILAAVAIGLANQDLRLKTGRV